MTWQPAESSSLDIILDRALERINLMKYPSQQCQVVHGLANRLFEQMAQILRHTEQPLCQFDTRIQKTIELGLMYWTKGL